MLNKVFHHITDTHVAHHLFSTMPHYHAMEATKAIKPVLGAKSHKHINWDAISSMATFPLQASTTWWTRRRLASRALRRRCGRHSSTASALRCDASSHLISDRFVEDFGGVLWFKFK